MSKKTIYIITKNKYDDKHRVIGFIKDFGKHIYYDFFSHAVQLVTKKDGSHYSYHEDGNVFRTSEAVGKEKITETVPIKKFNTYYDLCITALDKKEIHALKPFKENYRNKYIIIELDIEKYDSDFLNFILDMIHVDFYDRFIKNSEAQYPPKSDTFKRKLNKNVIIELTVLGYDNLLIEQQSNGFKVHHYNKRFTVNDKGNQYFSEVK